MLQTLIEAEAVKKITVPAKEVSDEYIIQCIRNGDIDAYGRIMRRYNQRIYRVARSIVTDDAAAMDIVQEAHIKAYTRLDSYRGGSGFFAWLAVITRNEALMYLRKNKKEISMQDDEIQFFDQENSNSDLLPDALLENKQVQHLINQNLDNLPENFRTVFVLRAVEQLSVRETAKILEIKEETVKTRFFRAKRLLREQIQIYLDNAGMKVYEFGGHHCDIVIKNVLERIKK